MSTLDLRRQVDDVGQGSSTNLTILPPSSSSSTAFHPPSFTSSGTLPASAAEGGLDGELDVKKKDKNKVKKIQRAIVRRLPSFMSGGAGGTRDACVLTNYVIRGSDKEEESGDELHEADVYSIGDAPCSELNDLDSLNYQSQLNSMTNQGSLNRLKSSTLSSSQYSIFSTWSNGSKLRKIKSAFKHLPGRHRHDKYVLPRLSDDCLHFTNAKDKNNDADIFREKSSAISKMQALDAKHIDADVLKENPSLTIVQSQDSVAKQKRVDIARVKSLTNMTAQFSDARNSDTKFVLKNYPINQTTDESDAKRYDAEIFGNKSPGIGWKSHADSKNIGTDVSNDKSSIIIESQSVKASVNAAAYVSREKLTVAIKSHQPDAKTDGEDIALDKLPNISESHMPYTRIINAEVSSGKSPIVQILPMPYAKISAADFLLEKSLSMPRAYAYTAELAYASDVKSNEENNSLAKLPIMLKSEVHDAKNIATNVPSDKSSTAVKSCPCISRNVSSNTTSYKEKLLTTVISHANDSKTTNSDVSRDKSPSVFASISCASETETIETDVVCGKSPTTFKSTMSDASCIVANGSSKKSSNSCKSQVFNATDMNADVSPDSFSTSERWNKPDLKTVGWHEKSLQPVPKNTTQSIAPVVCGKSTTGSISHVSDVKVSAVNVSLDKSPSYQSVMPASCLSVVAKTYRHSSTDLTTIRASALSAQRTNFNTSRFSSLPPSEPIMQKSQQAEYSQKNFGGFAKANRGYMECGDMDEMQEEVGRRRFTVATTIRRERTQTELSSTETVRTNSVRDRIEDKRVDEDCSDVPSCENVTSQDLLNVSHATLAEKRVHDIAILPEEDLKAKQNEELEKTLCESLTRSSIFAEGDVQNVSVLPEVNLEESKQKKRVPDTDTQHGGTQAALSAVVLGTSTAPSNIPYIDESFQKRRDQFSVERSVDAYLSSDRKDSVKNRPANCDYSKRTDFTDCASKLYPDEFSRSYYKSTGNSLGTPYNRGNSSNLLSNNIENKPNAVDEDGGCRRHDAGDSNASGMAAENPTLGVNPCGYNPMSPFVQSTLAQEEEKMLESIPEQQQPIRDAQNFDAKIDGYRSISAPAKNNESTYSVSNSSASDDGCVVVANSDKYEIVDLSRLAASSLCETDDDVLRRHVENCDVYDEPDHRVTTSDETKLYDFGWKMLSSSSHESKLLDVTENNDIAEQHALDELTSKDDGAQAACVFRSSDEHAVPPLHPHINGRKDKQDEEVVLLIFNDQITTERQSQIPTGVRADVERDLTTNEEGNENASDLRETEDGKCFENKPDYAVSTVVLHKVDNKTTTDNQSQKAIGLPYRDLRTGTELEETRWGVAEAMVGALLYFTIGFVFGASLQQQGSNVEPFERVHSQSGSGSSGYLRPQKELMTTKNAWTNFDNEQHTGIDRLLSSGAALNSGTRMIELRSASYIDDLNFMSHYQTSKDINLPGNSNESCYHLAMNRHRSSTSSSHDLSDLKINLSCLDEKLISCGVDNQAMSEKRFIEKEEHVIQELQRSIDALTHENEQFRANCEDAESRNVKLRNKNDMLQEDCITLHNSIQVLMDDRELLSMKAEYLEEETEYLEKELTSTRQVLLSFQYDLKRMTEDRARFKGMFVDAKLAAHQQMEVCTEKINQLLEDKRTQFEELQNQLVSGTREVSVLIVRAEEHLALKIDFNQVLQQLRFQQAKNLAQHAYIEDLERSLEEIVTVIKAMEHHRHPRPNRPPPPLPTKTTTTNQSCSKSKRSYSSHRLSHKQHAK